MLDTLNRNTERIHSMDALRAIAMLLGIVLHVSITYRLTSLTPWPVDDKIHSIFYDYLYLFLHSFRMQLFYLIAGFFARLLYLKIGIKAFIKHRLRRIVLPLVISIIIIAPLSMAAFIYYHYWALHPNQGFFKIAKAILPYVFKWNGMVHLWFLYYLSFYYVTMLGLIFIDKKPGILKKIIDFTYRRILLLPNISSIALLIIPVSLVLCLFRELPVEPYTGMMPRIPLYLYYGFFFFLGFTIHRYYINNLMVFTRNAIPYLIIGIAMVPIVWRLCYLHSNGDASSLSFILIRIIAATQTILLSFGFLGFFLKFTQSENYILRYISDASYWMYLVHLPIVVSMQTWFINSPVPPVLRFWIVNLAGIAIPLITYGLFVRYTIIGKTLNGPRKKRSQKGTISVVSRFPFVRVKYIDTNNKPGKQLSF